MTAQNSVPMKNALATSPCPSLPDWSTGISIIIPTFRRPEGLKTALTSVVSQAQAGRPFEIVVTDNDPQGGARAYVESVQMKSDVEIVYTHAPEPGVSNARNVALSVARGRYIIFLDDDMEATAGWVSKFINVAQQYQAGIVFLPAVAAMPRPNDPLNRYMAPFFSRVFDAPEGLVEDCLGTGGCLLDLNLCQMPNPPFDPALNEVGGEDDFLFSHLVATGSKVAWSPDALAHEHVPLARATPQYLWTRNFAFGQGPTQAAGDKGLKGVPEILKWMCVGAVQLVLFGSAFLVLKALKKPVYLKYMAKTAQALGKIFWWDGLTPRLYGASTLNAKPADSSV